jgi:hypothetical protein
VIGDLAGSFPRKLYQLFNDLFGVGLSVLTFGDNLSNAAGWLRDALMAKGWVQRASAVAGEVAGQLASGATTFFEYVIQPLANGFVRIVRSGLGYIQRALSWIASWAGEGWAGFGAVGEALADIYHRLDGFLGTGECNTVDAICNWFFKLLELGWTALKAILRTVVMLISGLLSLALQAGAFVLSRCGVDWDAFLGQNNLDLLRRILLDSKEGWGGSWRDALELFIQTKIQQLSEAAGDWAGKTPGRIGQSIGLLPIDTMIDWRLDEVADLIAKPGSFIPTDEQPRIDLFKGGTQGVYNYAYSHERRSAELDEGLALAELVLTIGVGVVMALGGVLKALASVLKIEAASLMKKLDAVQVGMAAVKAGKTLIYDIGGTVGIALGTLWVYYELSWETVAP